MWSAPWQDIAASALGCRGLSPIGPQSLVVPFGAGSVRLCRDDGTVVAVGHPERPGMTYLLDEAAEDVAHERAPVGQGVRHHRRGRGALGRADGARRHARRPDGLVARAEHALASGSVLDVERRIGGTWAESLVAA